jgi:hypothetical protein
MPDKQREPEVNSRSQLKRVAAMKGERPPTFEAAAPAQPVPPSDEYLRGQRELLRSLLTNPDLIVDDNFRKSLIAFGWTPPAAPSPVLTPLGICDNNSLLHPRTGKHEQMETCENWRPCAPVLTQPSAEQCPMCDGWEAADDAAHEYLDSHGAPPANGRGLYLRLDEILNARASSPAVAPKCPNCESTDPRTPGILTCGHEFHAAAPAVAGRTQGDELFKALEKIWNLEREDFKSPDAYMRSVDGIAGAAMKSYKAALRESASPMSGTEMLNSILATLESRADGVNTGGDINIMDAIDRIVKRESAREAPSDKEKK